MKIFVIIVGLLIVAIIIKSCKPTDNSKNEKRPDDAILPTNKIQNDKIVLIENASLDDVKNAIQKFCNVYNQNEFVALPLLTVLTEKRFAVTFPYDTDFVTYCFFVNYMHYPNDIIYKPSITAWTSTKQGDDWMTDDTVNKKVMLYIPAGDEDYDNVFPTTNDNIGYKMGFAMGEEKQRLPHPGRAYIEPESTAEPVGKEQIQFK